MLIFLKNTEESLSLDSIKKRNQENGMGRSVDFIAITPKLCDVTMNHF